MVGVFRSNGVVKVGKRAIRRLFGKVTLMVSGRGADTV